MRQILRKLRRRLEREEGFTLIELLVVILIIGILAAVAIPLFLSQTNHAYNADAKSNLKNAQTSVEAYANGNGGVYPAAATLTLIGGTGGVLSQAQDSDAAALGTDGSQSVYFTTGSATASSTDTYTLCAQGNSGTLWWIIVNAGVTSYADSSGTTCAGATTPTTGLQADGFPTG